MDDESEVAYFVAATRWTAESGKFATMGSTVIRNRKTVLAVGASEASSYLAGVHVLALPKVTMCNGFMMEIFRTDWPLIGSSVRQINWFQLDAGAVTGWHCHAEQTDHLIGVGGTLKLALWDGREASPSKGATQLVRMGAGDPVMVIVPAGVWHGLRNENADAAGYVQIIDELYRHENPDSRRLPLGHSDIPDVL